MRSGPWLSMLLLLLANIAFGLFLRDLDSSRWVWSIAIAYVLFECSVISVFWTPFHRMAIISFKSDVGYALSALLGASLVVVLAAWINISSHFLLMLAAALLVRIDLFTRRIGTRASFVVLLTISLIGLALSWLAPGLYVAALPHGFWS